MGSLERWRERHRRIGSGNESYRRIQTIETVCNNRCHDRIPE
jgi:hypothetical protein